MSCSRLNTRRQNKLCLLLRCPLRKMMQSWLHRLRPTIHSPRRQPAPCLRLVRRPLMASRLVVQFTNNLGSYNLNLFTDCLPRLPSRPYRSCSPCTARRKTSSSTTHGPVTNHAYTSSSLPLPLQWRHSLSGPITRPVSTATSPWSLWRPSSCRHVNACQKEMHLRLRPWPLCGDWNLDTRPSSRTKRCATSSWRPAYSPGKLFPCNCVISDERLKTCQCST